MIVKHNFYQNSQCLNSYLHRFEVKREYPQGVLEVCEICHKRMFFKIIDDKVDNQNYMSYHIHNALPPFHPMYERDNADPLDASIKSPYA